MKKINLFLLASIALLFVAAPLSAEESDAKAVAIVDKAIKAAGGKKALIRSQKMTWSDKGTYYGMGGGLPYEGKYAYHIPSKYRMEIVGIFTTVINGDKGWNNTQGATVELDKEQLAEMNENSYASLLTTLVPLKKKSVKLSMIGDAKVDGKAAVAIKATSKGHRDLDLFFDKESGLLVRYEGTVKSQEQGGKEVAQSTTLRDYKEVDGVKVAMELEVKQDGEIFVESKLSDVKFPEKLDDSLFEKP